jgi:hypothetical protein
VAPLPVPPSARFWDFSLAAFDNIEPKRKTLRPTNIVRAQRRAAVDHVTCGRIAVVSATFLA